MKFIIRTMVAVVFMMPVGQVFASQSLKFAYSLNNGPYLSISDQNQTGLDFAGNMTVETWIKVGANNYQGEVLFSKYDYAPGSQYYLLMNPSTNGDVKFVFAYFDQFGNFSYFVGAVPILNCFSDSSHWVHVAVVADVANIVVKYYRNGVLMETPTPYTGSSATSIRDAGADFQIGSYAANPGANSIDGAIKDFRVWNVARTAEQVASNYNHELNGAELGLVAYWKFNGNTNDGTSNHNNLVVHDSCSYIFDIPSCFDLSHLYIDYSFANNGSIPVIAALRVNDNSVPSVRILNYINNQVIGQVNFFDSLWTPKKILFLNVYNDSTPQVSVMASKGDSTKIESRSLSNGALIKTTVLP